MLNVWVGSNIPRNLRVLIKDAELLPQATSQKLMHQYAIYTVKLYVLVHSILAFSIFKRNPKSTHYKQNHYIHLRLRLWLYTFEYVFWSQRKMRNYLCKEGLNRRNKRYRINKQVKNGCSIILCPILPLSASLLIFFPLIPLGQPMVTTKSDKQGW